MLSPALLEKTAYEIETLGFSVVENVVDAAMTDRLKTALLTAIEEDQRLWAGRPQKNYDLIDNLVPHGGAFIELLDNPVMHQLFKAFLAPSYILYNYSSTFLLPGGTPGATKIHTDSPRVIKGYHSGLIMTLALDDFTTANGATLYLPGSQTLAAVPDPDTFRRNSQSVARPAGAAVFFNPRCFHKGEVNTTDTIRCGVTVFAVRAYMKQRFDFPRMLTSDAVAQLTPGARRFLGFDARVPASMAEFYVGEADRLYKAGQG